MSEPATGVPTRVRKRRAHRRRRALIVVAAMAAAATAIAGTTTLILNSRHRRPVARIGSPEDGRQLTTLLPITLSDDVSQQAELITLFAIGSAGEAPLVLFIPAGTLGQVPGQGFLGLGNAMSYGRPSLMQTAVENALGIVIDRTVPLDDVSVGKIVRALGGIDVDVTERLEETQKDGRRSILIPMGRQHLDGAQSVIYMTFRGEGSSDLDRFPREQKVFEAIFAAAGVNGNALSAAVLGLAQQGVTGDLAPLATILRALAATTQRPSYEVLPVDVVASGGADEAYQIDTARLDELITRALLGSRPAPGVAVGARVEIRNGNGTPEGGEHVAALLVSAGMRLQVSGNAGRFDYATTRIVVYGDDARARELGNRVHDLLGIGEIEVGTRGQTVVDVTVVVGKDFLKRRG